MSAVATLGHTGRKFDGSVVDLSKMQEFEDTEKNVRKEFLIGTRHVFAPSMQHACIYERATPRNYVHNHSNRVWLLRCGA